MNIRFLTKWQSSMLTLTTFSACIFIKGHAYSMIVHTRADRLLPQLLVEHFDTLPSRYMHIGNLHEEV